MTVKINYTCDAKRLGEYCGRVMTLQHACYLLEKCGVPRKITDFIYKGALHWVFARVFILNNRFVERISKN